MPRKTIPFTGNPNARGVQNTDRRFINFLIETNPDPIGKTQEVYLVKRPCLAEENQPPGMAAVGRGIYAWGATGVIYSVFSNIIYAGTSSTVSMNTSTGRVWFEETPANVGNQTLIISDGQDNYNIDTSSVVVQIDENDNANYPVNNLGPISYLNTYLIQAQSDGDIWNTNLNQTTSWAASNLTRAARRGDALEATHVIKDQLVAFGKNSMEFYYDSGAAFGSPLVRIEQNSQDFGLAGKETLAWSGGTVCFVGENASRGDGERALWVMSGLSSLKDVSDPAINRILKSEPHFSTASAWMERVSGQLIYCLNLNQRNRSFVFNLDNNTWTEWQSSSGERFNGVSATSLNGVVYVQGDTDGKVYRLNPNAFQDDGVAISTTIQTERMSFGTDRVKKQTELSLLADRTTGHISTSWSDDDYDNFNEPRIIDMSLAQKKLTRLGSFRERAYRHVYAGASTLRIQAAIHTYEEGTG